MTDKRPSGNPKLAERHKDILRKGDRELAGSKVDPGKAEPGRIPGKGKPDKEEGIGTVQNQKR